MACLCATATHAQKIKELSEKEKQQYSKQDSVTVITTVGPLKLPPPYATESVTFRHVMADWPEGQLPKVPAGFKVERLASDLKNPRTSYIADNDDLFVTESNTFNSADRITILRDADKNGSYEVREVFAENLKLPFGALIVKDQFYVALSDGLYVYPYKAGDLKLQGKGRKIVELPSGGYNNHWTRN
ncbi:MAG: sorbosone dehydrogenase family protein, partial [Flavobacterium sp.]